jgi:hypothetical protein
MDLVKKPIIPLDASTAATTGGVRASSSNRDAKVQRKYARSALMGDGAVRMVLNVKALC